MLKSRKPGGFPGSKDFDLDKVLLVCRMLRKLGVVPQEEFLNKITTLIHLHPGSLENILVEWLRLAGLVEIGCQSLFFAEISTR